MKSLHTCLWNEPLQVCEKVALAEFDWKVHNFLNIKTGEWDLTISVFNYWNNLVLGSLKTYFHEVAAYLCLTEDHFSNSTIKLSRVYNEIIVISLLKFSKTTTLRHLWWLLSEKLMHQVHEYMFLTSLRQDHFSK